MQLSANIVALNRPAFLDTPQPIEILVLELYWRNVVCIAMSTCRVVEHLNVVEDVATSLLSVEVGLTADTLPLEELEEAFGDCVVVAVPPPAHAGHQAMRFQERLPVMAAVLAPLI